MVGNGFPDALPGDVVVRRSARLPNRFRFMPENTLYGQSVCPDEINNEKGDRLRMRKMGCKQGPVCSSVATGLVLTALCISHGFVPADAAPQDRCACKYEGRVLPESVYRRAVFSNAEHKDTAVEVKDQKLVSQMSTPDMRKQIAANGVSEPDDDQITAYAHQFTAKLAEVFPDKDRSTAWFGLFDTDS